MVRRADAAAITGAFHVEHERMYGYSLENEDAPIELINVRVRAVGLTEKPSYTRDPYARQDAGDALKGERKVCIPKERAPKYVSVYDGHKTRHGNRITGPAVIEQVNTTLLLTSEWDCVTDECGSFVVYRKGEERRLASTLREKRS